MNTNQQWITTNMRFPADGYMDLKLEAVHKKVSVTSLIHKKLFGKRRSSSANNVDRIMANLAKLAKENSKYYKKGNISDALIEMRYEQ